MKMYRLVILVLVVLLIVSATALANVPDVKPNRGIHPDVYVCTTTHTSWGYTKTASACPNTMLIYTYYVQSGTAVAFNTTGICGTSYRKILNGGFAGKYVRTGDTQCIWHD
jgi:hypothetical protein